MLFRSLLPPPDVASLSIDGDVLSWPALDTAAYQLLGYEKVRCRDFSKTALEAFRSVLLECRI